MAFRPAVRAMERKMTVLYATANFDLIYPVRKLT